MRRPLTFQERLNLLGLILLVAGIAGVYLDSVAKPAPVRLAPPRPQGSVVQVVTPTALPTLLPSLAVTFTLPAAPGPGSTPAPSAAADEASFLAPASLEVTATPAAPPKVPDRIMIASIGLDAPVVPAQYQLLELDGQLFQQWEAPPARASGWQFTSAGLGAAGNTVLNGHHNIHGSVFERLIDLQQGDLIEVQSGGEVFRFRAAEKLVLAEEGQDISVRVENARWLEATEDERLTLITCWPAWDNSHRLIIVAYPAE